jgi:hypothetical protein
MNRCRDQELRIDARTTSSKKAKNKENREWKKEIREEKQESNLIHRFETVIKSLLLLYSSAIEIVFSLIRFSLCLQFYIVHLHRFGLLKGQNDVVSRLCINKKRGRVSTGFTRVLGRPGFTGQLPGRFLLRPGPVQAWVDQVPGWPTGPVQVSKLCSKLK